MPRRPNATMMNDELGGGTASALAPSLRFPEFIGHEPWTQKPLCGLCEINPSAAALPESFVYIDLDSVDSGTLTARKNINREDAPSRAQRLVSTGDTVFQVVRPYQRNNLFIDFEDGEAYVASTGYAQLRPRDSARFLYHAVHTDPFVSRVIAKCTGSSYPAISSSDLGEILLAVPPTPAEQQKIADCLTLLDEAIVAQWRKIQTLKAHQKGLMQHLFPQEGQTFPRLRFPEFRDGPEWQKRQISDLLEKTSKPAKLDDDTLYREIGVRSHGKGIFHKEPATGKALGEKRVFHVVPNALVINIVFAWEQALAVTTGAEEGFIASHRFPMFVPKAAQCDVAFIQRLFLMPAGKQLLKVASPGGAGRNRTLSQTEFEHLEVVVPETSEQTRIADCLASVDATIAAEASALAALKAHKTGLMQGLFPHPETE